MRKVLYFMVLSFPIFLFSGNISHSLLISESDLSWKIVDGYDYLSISGFDQTSRPGVPLLPIKHYTFLIPSDARIDSIHLVHIEKDTLSGVYNIYPAQQLYPVGSNNVSFTEPDSSIYNSSSLYPGILIGNFSTGKLSGFKLVNFPIYPVQYIPSEGKIILYTRMDFEIDYTEGVYEKSEKTASQINTFIPIVKSLIANPSDISAYSPVVKSIKENPTIDYVIITPSEYKSYFQPLADWKTKKGIYTEIVTTDSIYANYSGADSAEKIRNFISDANTNWGTVYFLLGGQADYEHNEDKVPRRDVFY